MNGINRLRAETPRVRWMITGSIGIEPLARAGDYMGALAKYQPYELSPLTVEQARDYVQDLARTGHLCRRQAIADAEADALIAAVGWRAPYYLDALAQKLAGAPCEDRLQAAQLVEEAVCRLIQPGEASTFGTWEEHLRKHYRDSDRTLAFAILTALAPHPQGASLDALLSSLAQPALTRDRLRGLHGRLRDEGFITWDGDDDHPIAFLNPLLRRWWQRYGCTDNA